MFQERADDRSRIVSSRQRPSSVFRSNVRKYGVEPRGETARSVEETRSRNPTQEAWTILKCLENAVQNGELPRDRIGAIRRILKTYGVD